MRIGVFKPYHPCWHSVVYAEVVFASASCWGSPPRKARWGGLKETRGGVVLFALRILFVFKKLPFYSYCSFAFLLFALPAYNFRKKTIGKIFARTRKFCPKKLNLSSRIENTTQAARQKAFTDFPPQNQERTSKRYFNALQRLKLFLPRLYKSG